MRKSSIVLSLATIGLAAAAYAAKPADVIAARQANYKQIGRSFKAIMDEMRKPDASLVVIQANARTIDGLAGKVKNWYPKGSGPEAGVKTEASPAIWTDRGGFNAAAGNFAGAARTLRAAADKGDLAAVKAAFGPVGGTCKGCHDKFRVKQ